jgi:hypothetical protein
MKSAIAQRSFTRSDTREPVKVGQRISGADGYLMDLSRIGLVREVKDVAEAPETKANPSPAVGREQVLSASPAAQASPQTSAKESGSGGKRKRKRKDG